MIMLKLSNKKKNSLETNTIYLRATKKKEENHPKKDVVWCESLPGFCWHFNRTSGLISFIDDDISQLSHQLFPRIDDSLCLAVRLTFVSLSSHSFDSIVSFLRVSYFMRVLELRLHTKWVWNDDLRLKSTGLAYMHSIFIYKMVQVFRNKSFIGIFSAPYVFLMLFSLGFWEISF